MLSQNNKIYIPAFIMFFILLSMYSFAQNDVPPSPAGGKSLDLRGGKQGYYYAEDINNCFDDELLKNGMTIEFWFCPARPVKKGEGWNIIAKLPIYQIEVVYFDFGILDGEGMCLRLSIPGSRDTMRFYDLSKTEEYNPEWHHFVFQGNVSEDRFYWIIFLDGVSKGNFNSPLGFITDSDYPLYIGGLSSDSKTLIFVDGEYITTDSITFDGLIDEIRISDIQRYEQKAHGDKINIQKRFEPDEHTVALWHFDERSEDLSYKDDSGNGHTLFAIGQLTAITKKYKIPSLWGIIKK